jgi:NAD(P)-dependent dehydrogenase (short-subunit alcohol dehydrogenase family)
MTRRFDGKHALVTGGSQGLGLAIAARLAEEGAAVVAVASSSKEKAAAAISAFPDPHLHLAEVCDVRDASAVNNLVARITERFGALDILVNAAGVFYPTPAGDTEEDTYDRMVDINLKGTWNLINAITPLMKSRKAGKIVNVASVAAVMGIGGYAVYCATKAGIIMLTRALANELAPHGINVNCIAPGNTATPMNEDIRTKPELRPFLDAMTARTPSPRTYSEPSDMAAIACFLLSDEARAMHGSCILADEGFSAGICS